MMMIMMMMMTRVPRGIMIQQDRRERCITDKAATAYGSHKQQNWIQNDDSLAQNLTKKLLSASPG